MPNREEPKLGGAASQLRAAEPYISAVWKLVGGAAVGVLGGYFLDRWLRTSPWLLVALSTIGIAVGFYGFLHALLRTNKR